MSLDFGPGHDQGVAGSLTFGTTGVTFVVWFNAGDSNAGRIFQEENTGFPRPWYGLR